MKENCIFCNKYKDKDEGVFYTNDLFFAQFDIFPISPGHTEIIPIRHIASLDELDQEEWNNLRSEKRNL